MIESSIFPATIFFLAEEKFYLMVALNSVPPVLFLCHQDLEGMLFSQLSMLFVRIWVLIAALLC